MALSNDELLRMTAEITAAAARVPEAKAANGIPIHADLARVPEFMQVVFDKLKALNEQG